MFGSRERTVVTFAVVLEGAIAGWALGAGWLGLLAMVAAVTIADTAWGIARRGTSPTWRGSRWRSRWRS